MLPPKEVFFKVFVFAKKGSSEKVVLSVPMTEDKADAIERLRTCTMELGRDLGGEWHQVDFLIFGEFIRFNDKVIFNGKRKDYKRNHDIIQMIKSFRQFLNSRLS